jgi:hypothetical protein
MLRIIFFDKDLNLLNHWNTELNGLHNICFENIDSCEIVGRNDIDAVVLRSIFVLERYGGKPIHGKSQIFNTQSDDTMPDFVITTPTHLANNSPLEGEWDSSEWLAIFTAVDEFNMTAEEKICKIGVEISFLYGFRKHLPYQEVDEFRKSYLSYYNIS